MIKKNWKLKFEVPKEKKEVFDFVFEGTLDTIVDVVVNYKKEPNLNYSNIVYEVISENKKKIRLLEKVLNQQKIYSTIEPIKEKNWIKLSNKLKPKLNIGIFAIYSSVQFNLNEIKSEVPILITYNNGFGTGQHPTTHGCLVAFQELRKKRKFNQVLEIGSGSGILTVALERIFKAKITAIEYDLQAYQTSKNNFIVNKIGKKINLLHQSSISNSKIITNSPYDLIVANILAGPIIKFSNEINNISNKNTILILSGFYYDQSLRIVNEYRQFGFFKIQHYKIDNWITLVLKKKNK